MSLWTLDSALAFVRELHPALNKAGFAAAMTGSVLILGGSDNDLDLVIYPLNAAECSYAALREALEGAGMRIRFPRHIVARAWHSRGSNDIKTVEAWETPGGRRVDLFLLR